MADDFVDFDQPDGKARSSPVLKILLLISGVGVLVLCVVCGVLMSTFNPEVITTDPDEAATTLAEIAPGLRPPEVLPPQMVVGSDVLYVFPMRAVIGAMRPLSKVPAPSSLFVVMQFQDLVANNPQLRKNSVEIVKQLGPIDAGETVVKTESGDVVVGGEIVPVQVYTVKRNTGALVKRAHMSLNTPTGPAVVMLQRPKDNFSIQEFQRIVQDAETVELIDPLE